jgi:heptosyltransferase-1
LGTQAQFRLLVVRLGAMGDILHALPAIAALRQAHPAWKIDWAIEPRWLPLLTAEPQNAEPGDPRTQERPLVDQIYFVPVKDWGKGILRAQTWREIRELRRELRAAKYDAVLDMQSSIRSALVAKITGCKRILGMQDAREAPAKFFYSECIPTKGVHVIEQGVELADALAGDQLTAVPPPLPVDPEAELWCEEHQELKSAIWMSKPVVLIHPGGGWGAKRWPAERYGAVAEEFAIRGGVVLVNAGPGEEEIAAEVVAASGRAIDQVHIVQCTLEQLIALTRHVSLVIGGDTGPLHLACALGKPVVGIYGPTDPKRNGPFGSRFRVLRNPESRTDHARRNETEAGLLTIAPETVVEAVVSLMLDERKARQAQAENVPPREQEPAWGGADQDRRKESARWSRRG